MDNNLYMSDNTNSACMQTLSKEDIQKETKELKPEMRLYKIEKTYYCKTEEELRSYCESKGLSMKQICILDYIRNFAGRSDVIRETYKEDGNTTYSIIYTAVDEDGYGIYNHQRSIEMGTFVWEFCYGSIEEMYSAFRNRGIVFENDIYEQIDKENKQFLKMCQKNNFFNTGHRRQDKGLSGTK